MYYSLTKLKIRMIKELGKHHKHEVYNLELNRPRILPPFVLVLHNL